MRWSASGGVSMKNRKDEIRTLSIVLKSLSPSPIPENVGTCSVYTETDYHEYTSFKMDKPKRTAFDEHWEGCLSCQSGLLKNILEEERKIDEKEAASLKKRSMETVRETIDRLLDPGIMQPAYLLAASSGPDEGRKEELIGISYGVGVDSTAKAGFLIDCVARVGKEEVERGSLKFNVDQIAGFTRDNLEYDISPPFQFLENKLKDLFIYNDYLLPFRLNHRHVSVEIEHSAEPGFFREAKSLALSVIVAILSALTGKKTVREIVFSARVRQDGALLPPVGDIPFKLSAAKANGKRSAILSEANRTDCPREFFEDAKFPVLFFSHIGQVLQHLELVPEIIEKASVATGAPEGASPAAEVWQAGFPHAEGRDAIIGLAKNKGISGEVVEEFIEATEDLSQMRIELRPLSTALVIGDPGKIAGRLLPSEMEMTLKSGITHMLGHLRALATVVNGEMTGFVFNKAGCFDSIRKTNITAGSNFPGTRLLSGRNRRYGVISSLTESLIFVLTPGGNRVQVFCDGHMVARYLNGTWKTTDLNRFEEHLTHVAHEKEYDLSTLKRIGKIALRMADLNLGALIVLFDDLKTVRGRYDDRLEQLGVKMIRRSLQEMTDKELINFAREDGAMLIEGQGNLHTFKAFLKPTGTGDLDYDLGIGARHLSAHGFSADARCMTMVVSEDGAVTLYCDGKKICRI